MSLLTQIIGKANFEIARSKIASILVDEIANQKALNEAAKVVEESKPSPDPVLIAFYESNINALPSRVWEERFKRPQKEEYREEPLINVLFANAPLNENQTASTQLGDDTFIVEVYAGEWEPGEETPNNEGDSLASIKLQRCLAICRAIIMNPQYQQLGLGYEISKVSVNNLQISQPSDGEENAAFLIYGRFNVTVKISETIEATTGLVLALGSTTYELTDKGYFWTSQSN